jgi:hypothetical protein
MATATIGEVHVFQCLFLDSVNDPFAVESPTIDVFYFQSDETKVMLVDGAAMTGTSETGRYVYVYTVSDSFLHGMTIYAEMQGIEPEEGLTVFTEQVLDLVSVSSAGGTMASRFVKGG